MKKEKKMTASMICRVDAARRRDETWVNEF